MDPSIQETQDGMFGVVIGKRKKEDPIFVDTKEKARFEPKSRDKQLEVSGTHRN